MLKAAKTKNTTMRIYSDIFCDRGVRVMPQTKGKQGKPERIANNACDHGKTGVYACKFNLKFCAVDMPRHKEKGDKSRNPLKDIAPITEIGKSAYGNA